MKKNIYFIIILLVLGLLVSGCQSVIPDEDLSRAPIKAVFEQIESSPNLNINGTLMLNDKNNSVTVSLSDALPENEYRIQLEWSYEGEGLRHTWITMSDKNGRLHYREIFFSEIQQTIWLADQVTIYIMEKTGTTSGSAVLIVTVTM
jgi:hypothetical protein